MRFDTHVHVWDLAVRDQPWTASEPRLRRSFALADLAPSLDAHGIDGVVLVQTVASARRRASCCHSPRARGGSPASWGGSI